MATQLTSVNVSPVTWAVWATVLEATNKLQLPHDYPIRHWEKAGLQKPSIARADRIARIPADYLGTAGYIGRLDEEDRAALVVVLREIAEG